MTSYYPLRHALCMMLGPLRVYPQAPTPDTNKQGKPSHSLPPSGSPAETQGHAALTEDEQLKRSAHEVALMRLQLSEKQEEARRHQSKAEELRHEVHTSRAQLMTSQNATEDITTDLTRQYKLMQTQLMSKITALQDKEKLLTDQLGAEATQQALDDVKAQASRAIREKDDKIAQLTQRIESMETAYENVLNEALDSMASRVEEARDKWEVDSYVVQQRNKDVLMEFGLSHVAI
ncbi:uncharacterized protein MONBRDRAFT_27099 [Monosiga brevicollis MX1]|uniref:Dynein regulatory complex protein 12 n=1 Tax=Monosiga brevicollis TaxID=81824 RepID=A9V4A8_MONBE|nr:uncharacterized protein MONBRDRAFT_27099 [Monosiga brevicollis MX1]EDQ87677.1 predicted protein [Monosiga brevicollis MX1]|eukprot:XP_001747597.1 hypothetical protein [Monosiga brevicollis MX1]